MDEINKVRLWHALTLPPSVALCATWFLISGFVQDQSIPVWLRLTVVVLWMIAPVVVGVAAWTVGVTVEVRRVMRQMIPDGFSWGPQSTFLDPAICGQFDGFAVSVAYHGMHDLSPHVRRSMNTVRTLRHTVSLPADVALRFGVHAVGWGDEEPDYKDITRHTPDFAPRSVDPLLEDALRKDAAVVGALRSAYNGKYLHLRVERGQIIAVSRGIANIRADLAHLTSLAKQLVRVCKAHAV